MNTNNKDASLVVINYDALANKDVEEIQKLVQACESVGMFYLDLGNSRMKDVYKGIPSLLRAGSAFFDLPADCEEKNQSLREGMERGYERRNYSHNGQFPLTCYLVVIRFRYHAAKTFEYYEVSFTSVQEMVHPPVIIAKSVVAPNR